MPTRTLQQVVKKQSFKLTAVAPLKQVKDALLNCVPPFIMGNKPFSCVEFDT